MVKRVDRKLSNQKLKRRYPTKVTLDCYYVAHLVWAYKREIEKSLNDVKRIKNIDKIFAKSKVLTWVALRPLKEDLSILEPLMECYLAGRDGKTRDTGFNMGDGQLYKLLEEIRRFIKEFPPHLETFYQNYTVYYKERILPRSPVCKICNERGASHHYANAKVHSECLEKINAKYCEYCTNLYLNSEMKCTNKPECANYQLKDAKAKGMPLGVISMQIPKELINKTKTEAQEKNQHRQGE